MISGNKIKTESFAYVPLKTLNLIKANKKAGIKGADEYGESYKLDIRARCASLFSTKADPRQLKKSFLEMKYETWPGSITIDLFGTEPFGQIMPL